MKYYIYKYVYQNQIVYIGKTQQLDTRIKQHNEEIRFFGLKEIYYFEVNSKQALDANERYYIMQYKPPMNRVVPIINKDLDLVVYDPQWVKYNYQYTYPLPFIKSWYTEIQEENLIPSRLFVDFKQCKDFTFNTLDLPVYEYAGISFILTRDLKKFLSKIRKFYHQKYNFSNK